MSAARPLAYARRFSAEETEVLVGGIAPREMDEHWFIFEEVDVLHLVRSWTEYELFTIKLRRLADGGAEIAEVMLNEHARTRQRRWRFGRRPRVEDFERDARCILDVLFDSVTANPTLAVGLAGHVYGLGRTARVASREREVEARGGFFESLGEEVPVDIQRHCWRSSSLR